MTTLDDIEKRLDRIEKMTATNKNVLTLDEAAALTGYSVKYLRLLVSRRELPCYRRGNRLYFDRNEVEVGASERTRYGIRSLGRPRHPSLLVGVSGNATLGIMVTGFGLTHQKASHGQQNHHIDTGKTCLAVRHPWR